jgi:hypothetical protein
MNFVLLRILVISQLYMIQDAKSYKLLKKKPCKRFVYKVFCGVDGSTVEHLVPILTFLDSLKL